METTASKTLMQSDLVVQREREQMEDWAGDQIIAADQALQDTKFRL